MKTHSLIYSPKARTKEEEEEEQKKKIEKETENKNKKKVKMKVMYNSPVGGNGGVITSALGVSFQRPMTR